MSSTNWQIGRATEALAARSAVNSVWNNSDNSRRGGGVHIGELKAPASRRGRNMERNDHHADELYSKGIYMGKCLDFLTFKEASFHSQK